MNQQLADDLKNIQILLELTKKKGLDFLDQINDRPTSVKLSQQAVTSLPEKGIGGKQTLELFKQKHEHHIVASTGPRYLGYVIGGATPAALMGDWLASIYDQNPQTTQSQGDVSVCIELDTIQMMLNLFGLPKNYMGGFVTGATMSNFTCLAVARQWIGQQHGIDIAKKGVSISMPILSAVPHSSSIKALAMLGLGSQNMIPIAIEQGNRESIDIEDLTSKIAKLNGAPFILISSAGTVNTTDFDNFEAITELKKKHHFWWHIDGAFGAFAACSPTYKHLVKGWETADSITIDCHKWMNVPYESAVFFVKKKHQVLQTETFQNSNAPYLGDPSKNFNYLNFLPENSRRLKALPVWFSLNAYGKKGFQYIVENAVEMALLLGDYIQKSDKFELLAPVRLNNVCFTLKGVEDGAIIKDFLQKLNDSGNVFMTPTVYKHRMGIRASFVNWRTNISDIETIKAEMNKT